MEFFAKDVYRIAEVERFRLREWIVRGFITPSIQTADGPGTRNIFSKQDLCEIILLKRLIEAGHHREEAAKLVQNFNMNSEARPISFRGVMNVKALEPNAQFWLVVSTTVSTEKISGLVHLHGVKIESDGNPVEEGFYFLSSISELFKAGAIQILVIDLGRIVRWVDSQAPMAG